ncbi:MAG: glycogen/starch/alpha-glucan phosphorylase [Prochloraceae cyanobacterium]
MRSLIKEEFSQRRKVEIQVEDDRTGFSTESLQRAFADHLLYSQGKYESLADLHDYYMALAYTIRDRLVHRRVQTVKTWQEKNVKVVYYLSAEFLMGRQLGINLVNLGLYEKSRQALENLGLDLDKIMEQEEEPGLGNGGLGRLAACFMESLATLEIPARGYGIHYDFGIFNQSLQEGWQLESPDHWLRLGNPWEIARPEYRVEVKFGGQTETYTDAQGQHRIRWIPQQTVFGTPYDLLVPGYGSNTVNSLRLWSARASEEFNFEVFNSGDYLQAVTDKVLSENISKVLYPNENTPQGRKLRLQQQYFFVACSLQDIIRLYLLSHSTFDHFNDQVAIQLNDTHPAIAVAELMRLLVDEHGCDWETAWSITEKTIAFTNHTLLPEALERWQVDLFGSLLPRHLEIIYEINQRFLNDLKNKYPGDWERLKRMSLIEEEPYKQVRMAHLACVGSHAINGVAALHTKLLKQEVLRDFHEMWPEKLSNKTNGVTPRRWILLSNPRLAYLISQKIGQNWVANLKELKLLEAYVEDNEFRQSWQQVKQSNKEDLADYIQLEKYIEVNLDSLFDVQVKRIHEYKRQLLNVLHIITLYNRIKHQPEADILPRTFILAGKAAPGYQAAKLIIKLINDVAEVVNHDPEVKDRLKVVFLANFSVSLGEKIYPAADLSEQISTAGKEASGTGNMKFALNGALTIGTLDGANIEIREAVEADNFFLFGLRAEEVSNLFAQGYNPYSYYHTNVELQEVIARISSGYFSNGDTELFKPIVEELIAQDSYALLADYQSYVECQERVAAAYRDQDNWIRMSILNAARTGRFSSDRTIGEYCQEIWQVKPVPIEQIESGQAEMSLRLARKEA